MSEYKGKEFNLLKTITPHAVVHEEYLNYESQVIADRMLEPVQQELASRVCKEVKSFLDRKKFLPDTDKDVYRNLTPINLRLRFSGDSLDDFRNVQGIGHTV